MSRHENVVTLVLAAGRGERMGGPKALLSIEGRSLAVLHAERALGQAVIVARRVVASKLHFISSEHPSARHYAVVESTEPDELGPAGSIAAAVRASAVEAADLVVITPVDVLPRAHVDLARLLDALADPEPQAARFERGHPVVVRAAVLRREYRHGAPILRDLLAALPIARVAGMPHGHLEDLDRPEDVLRVTGALPRFVG